MRMTNNQLQSLLYANRAEFAAKRRKANKRAKRSRKINARKRRG